MYTATIMSTPAGTPVSGSTNIFDYPILSSVTLTCIVNPSPPVGATYRWTTSCFTNNRHDTQTCFPAGQTTQSVNTDSLLAEDAGSIACTVTISGDDYGSDLFTLRVSGMFTVGCIIVEICNVQGIYLAVSSVTRFGDGEA